MQGAPGTGKTAVGLHRAAYLLYAHRARLAATGVLVVGPNRAFLAYVQEVLPALGEVQVTQVTADELAPAVPVKRVEPAAVALLKGDARLARVLERALWQHAVRASEPFVHPSGVRRWRVPPDEVRELERLVRGRRLGWTAGRAALRTALAGVVVRQQEDAGATTSDRSVELLARTPHVQGVRRRAVAAADREGAGHPAAHRPGPAGGEPRPGCCPTTSRRCWCGAGTAWSRADLPLLDEAAHLLERVPGYAHVVVDEAQDLSPMQLRAIGRRCVTGSATVLGDLAQGTAPGAPGSWPEVLAHLGKPEGRLESLTTGYRVPREVLELANRLLPTIAPGLAPAAVAALAARLAAAAPGADLVPAAAEAVGRRSGRGSVAVVAADPGQLEQVGRLLAAQGVDAEHLSQDGPAGRVALVPAELVKGLEFDTVVLLEPAAVAATGPAGLRLLYVALTRAVSSLVVLHEQDLPGPLLGEPGRA